MRMDLLVPIALIGQSFLAAVVYAIYGNWWKAVYWFAGGTITICVTFGK
jgi:hypothetical protein